MLRVGCGLDPYPPPPVIDTPATPLQTRWGLGSTHRGACSWPSICILCLWVVVLIIWQLGRLIVDKQQDYEGLCASKESAGWERPVICEAERKLAGAGWSSLLTAEPRKWKARTKRIYWISWQKIVDSLERLIWSRFIVVVKGIFLLLRPTEGDTLKLQHLCSHNSLLPPWKRGN